MIFIHSQVDGCLGHFQLCSIIDNFITQSCLWVFIYPCFLMDKFLAMVLLGGMVNLCVPFKETVKMFSTMVYHFIFLSAMHKGSKFSASLLALGIVCLFNYSYASLSVLVSPCSINLHFLSDYWCSSSFHVFITHLSIFFTKWLRPKYLTSLACYKNNVL